ncbi:GNAT family N-acetyltransferase [Flavobacterium sp. MK4S-17]|uniref:GNAT family N-acetyltransferase n=1 Tax=Flavobacterium sp. MK4S-17 TaxID=2543737 RepID=UPI001F1CB881|nr:GNAT family N-acetyltransferase [Flavobacterium sp. MK4S-17]
MQEITFKPITVKDIDIAVSMMHDFYAIDNYPMDRATAKNLFIEFVENDSLGKSWLIYFEGEPVGYVILTFIFSFEYKGRIAFLDELFIIPQARGNGLGKKVLDFIHRQAKIHSVRVIYLEVEGHNEIAQKLYASKNFTVHNRKLMKSTIS